MRDYDNYIENDYNCVFKIACMKTSSKYSIFFIYCTYFTILKVT